MDTSCVDVCPVDCIHLYTGDDPNIPKNLLLIDPVECIDCSACEPACPWEAIYADSDVPPEFAEYTEINARIAGQTDIVQTPNFDKPDPSPEDVEANRQKWLELYRNKAVGPWAETILNPPARFTSVFGLPEETPPVIGGRGKSTATFSLKPAEDFARVTDRCFRHQVLLRRHWQSLILDNEQDAEVNEYRCDLLRCRKNNWRQEDFS
jgi:ferredoxin